MKILATISTKDRYFTTLPLAINAVAMQTHRVDKIIIFDDGEQADLRKYGLYTNLFRMLDDKKIAWEVAFGERKGQVKNHQKALGRDTEWIWRLDDDNVPEANCLENLVASIDNSVGAVGGLVLHPTQTMSNIPIASNKIEDIYLGMNRQWFKHAGISEVDHLYSTFLFRKEACKHGYCQELSVVGHREETIFTYEMKRNGWKILINPAAVTWHMKDGSGGIRSFSDGGLWAHDEEVFKKKLREWNVTPTNYKFAVLDNGLGDHIAFKMILDEVKERYKDAKLIIAACYPEVFKDDGVQLISIADAKNVLGNLDPWNVYKYMFDKGWTGGKNGNLIKAYREVYKCS